MELLHPLKRDNPDSSDLKNQNAHHTSQIGIMPYMNCFVFVKIVLTRILLQTKDDASKYLHIGVNPHAT